MNTQNDSNQIPLGKGNNITIEGYDNEDMSIFDEGVKFTDITKEYPNMEVKNSLRVYRLHGVHIQLRATGPTTRVTRQGIAKKMIADITLSKPEVDVLIQHLQKIREGM